MDGGVFWLQTTIAENQHPVPVVVAGLVAVQVEHGFAEEPMVESFVLLELNFCKEDSFGGGIFGR
jgi:hypothetical protein